MPDVTTNRGLWDWAYDWAAAGDGRSQLSGSISVLKLQYPYSEAGASSTAIARWPA